MSDLFLHATIAGQAVAIPTADVDSVIALDIIVPVPGSPLEVRGIAALRSRVVTVIDPVVLLGAAPAQSDRAVVVAIDGHLYALIVDALEDVAPGIEEPIAVSAAAHPAWRTALRGSVLHDGRPVAVIDVRALIPQPHAAAA